jgi:hypothetical protein
MFWFSDNGFKKKGKVGRVFIFCFYFQSNMGRVFIFCFYFQRFKNNANQFNSTILANNQHNSVYSESNIYLTVPCLVHISRLLLLLGLCGSVILSRFSKRTAKADFFLVNNISVIAWRSALLVEEIGVSGENHRPPASH